MKSPDDMQPSGDRTIGRLLMAALSRPGSGVRLASRLRTWSGSPSPDLLTAYRKAATNEISALIMAYQTGSAGWHPDLWFTYHSYYKAPDLVGPAVARSLGIPYVITEASYSARRADGPWSDWLGAARDGIETADAIFSFTHRDALGLEAICASHRLHTLAPFLDLTPFERFSASSTQPVRHDPARPVRLVTVAMMRPGAKFASYQVLAVSLEDLSDLNWHLDIIGDGVLRRDIEQAFSHLPSERLTWHGVLEAPAIRDILAKGDIFAWPGIEEAFGMAFLEAQACGLPVAAVHTAGVPEVVHHEQSGLLSDESVEDGYGRCLRRLISDAALRSRLSTGAQAKVKALHSIDAASAHLNSILTGLVPCE